MESRDGWIEIRVGAVVATLLAISGLLAIVSFTGRAIDFPDRCVLGTVRCFFMRELDVGQEQNVPTWWSSMLLLVGGVLAALAAAESRRRRSRAASRWILLCLILVAASMDEFLALHEKMSPPMRAHFAALSRAVGHAWLVPGFVIAAVAALALLPLLRDVSPRVRAWMIGAAGVYLSGALGMELVDGVSRPNPRLQTSLLHVGFSTFEELLEFAGASLVIGMLLVHLRERGAGVRVAGAGAGGAGGASAAAPPRAAAALRGP